MNTSESEFRKLLDVQDLSPAYARKKLSAMLKKMTRIECTKWLKWNDRNGVYLDLESIREFGQKLSKNEAMDLIKKQILEA